MCIYGSMDSETAYNAVAKLRKIVNPPKAAVLSYVYNVVRVRSKTKEGNRAVAWFPSPFV